MSKKIKANEVIFKSGEGLYINGDKYGIGIYRIEIGGPNDIVIYIARQYKDDKFYRDTDFHKVEELKKYDNIKLYIEE